MNLHKIFNIIIKFFFSLVGIYHFAMPFWLDIIFALLLIIFFKKKIQAFLFMIFCLILAFSTNYLWGEKRIDEVFYRPHEKYSNKDTYDKNITDEMFVPYGDLYALSNKKIKDIEKIIDARKVKFKTDSLGYRNNVAIKDADILLAGNSFIIGTGTTQSKTPTSQLQNLTNLKVANIAYSGSVNFQEKKLIRYLKNKKNDQKIFFFYFEGSDFKIIEKNNTKKLNYIQKIQSSLNIDFEKIKDNYLDFIYPAKYSFFRILRKNVKIRIANIKLKNFNPKINTNIDSIIIKKIGSKHVAFYKKYNEIFTSKHIDTYIFKDETVIKNIDAIIFIPSKYRVYSSFFNSDKNKKNLPLEILQKKYKKIGIPVFDLTKIFISESQKYINNNKFIYWRDDTHWNESGIYIGMKYISEKIIKIKD